MASGGGAADADEQPRPGGSREATGPGGVRGERQGGAQLALATQDYGMLAGTGERRDAAGAERQACGDIQDDDGRAQSADCQLELGAALGHARSVLEAGGAGPHDVWADDGGKL